MSTSSQPLSAVVSLHSRFARSVHLERDYRQPTGQEYYLTESARQLLQTVLTAIERPAERAMIMVGPYGAGKSAFCLFAAELLSGRSQLPVKKLQEADQTLAAKVACVDPRLVPIPIVGARQPLGEALVRGLLRALESGNYAALRARIGAEATRLLEKREITPSDIADLYLLTAQTARSLGGGGLLLILDELGKFLEYATLHPQGSGSDVYILQALAEASARSGDAPFLVIGVLHQHAEAYAQKLGRAQQAEWAKVGERFRPVNFFPSDVERIEMVGRALRHAPGLVLNGQVTGVCEQYLKLEHLTGSLPKRFPEMARAAYPLHPLTLLALPALFRRSGQSHRSLFNFLAAEESHALGAFLREQVYSPEAPPFYTLDLLFDYASEVLLGGWHASNIVRLWADAVESVERAASLDTAARRVLKCIALLGIIKDPRLPASREVLTLALAGNGLSRDEVAGALITLDNRRLVVTNRSRKTYRLWEGGDVDVEAEIAQARRTLPASSTLHVAAKLCPPPRLIARRHSFETGTTRVVEVRPCNSDRLSSTVHEVGSELAIVLCLAVNAEDEERARFFAGGCAQRNILIGIGRETDALRDAATDIAAAHHVELHTDALQNDRAARRELSARRAEAEQAFVAEWNRLFGPEPEVAKWWRLQKNFALEGERRFSAYLSEMATSTYYNAPTLRNELINRRALSSAAAGGRRSLIEGMLTRESEESLGIKLFPPELSMYRCVLEATGLHRQVADGVWGFVPPVDAGPGSVLPVWTHIDNRLFSGPPEPVPLSNLYAELIAPPFGLTEGVIPLLLTAFLLAHRDETTLYREGSFLPEPSVADFEVLLRRPELFAVAGCRVVGVRKVIVERLAAGLQTRPAVVPIVRDLLKRVKGLPDHAWKTRRLPPEVLAFRELCGRARSPERFLFHDLPDALGVPLLAGEQADPQNVDTFFASLNRALKAWRDVSMQVVQDAQNELLTACGMSPGEEGWGRLRQRALELDGTITHPVLGPFIKRLAEPRDTVASVDTVLALLANRPPRSWTDGDVESFPAKARAMGELFREMDRALRAPLQSPLSAEEECQSREIARAVRAQLPAGVPPQVLRAAVLALLGDIEVALTGEVDHV